MAMAQLRSNYPTKRTSREKLHVALNAHVTFYFVSLADSGP
jgi:hypothetical protein